MDRATGRKVVADFFALFTESDVDGVMALLTDSVSWQMMGQQGGLPVSGSMNRQEIAAFIVGGRALVVDRIEMSPSAWTIELPRIAVEVESHATLKNGRVYHNFYHYLFILKDGKIDTIKEYADTDQVRRVFLDP